MRTASGSAHVRRTHPAMDATFLLLRQFTVPPLSPPTLAGHNHQSVSEVPALRDGLAKHLRSPRRTRLATPPPRDNSADNSRFATPQRSPLDANAPPFGAPDRPQAGTHANAATAPAQPLAPPASSAGTASTAAAFGQFRRPDRWVMPVLGAVPSRPSRVSGHPTGAGALPP